MENNTEYCLHITEIFRGCPISKHLGSLNSGLADMSAILFFKRHKFKIYFIKFFNN